MAFAQQQRRPTRHTTQQEVLYSDHHHQVVVPVSGSDNDWHVISSALPSSTASSSPILLSESESSRPSDIESDFQQEAFLPSHDGTGTFIVEDVEFFSSDQTSEQSLDEIESDDSTHEFKSALQNLTSDNSILDILLPNGTPPSFISGPTFVPTTAGLNSQELTNGLSSSAENVLQQQQQQQQQQSTLLSDEALSDHIKFTTKKQKNLDRIPIHHPGIPGSSTSAAILSLVWANLKRLTNHLLENDTNTVETLSNLMSEAVLEGCMPFGSHLHMEIETTRSYSLLEGS